MFSRLIQPIGIGEEDINIAGIGDEEGNGNENGIVDSNDLGLVLTSDPKPRLRWTNDLHDRFVDAVTQLGGPAS